MTPEDIHEAAVHCLDLALTIECLVDKPEPQMTKPFLVASQLAETLRDRSDAVSRGLGNFDTGAWEGEWHEAVCIAGMARCISILLEREPDTATTYAMSSTIRVITDKLESVVEKTAVPPSPQVAAVA